MPNLNPARVRQYLGIFDFKNLFIQEMGWDRAGGTPIPIQVNQEQYELVPVAKKRLLVVFECRCETIPNRATQKKIHAELRKVAHENFIIFTDKDRTDQRWFFVWRDPGKTIRAHVYGPNEDLRQRLEMISFSLAEEDALSPIEVLSRVRGSFDVDRVTKSFYDDFKKEHTALMKFLQGIPDKEMKAWYVSVTLNRLMFVYFIQKKGFLDQNQNYLLDKLAESKSRGQDVFYKGFLCPLFFNGFAQKEDERDPATRRLLGDIPYLNGGIFQRHQLEERYGEAIQIPDRAFDQLFAFFEKYRWHLDDNPNRQENEINPDVLGYIFEKYINQKQMGAYYTKEDITGYISRNTIIPWLFDQAQKKCKIAFEGQQSVWNLLQAEPERYIYPAVQKGCGLPLPPEIEAGVQDVSQRTLWNTPAPEEYALPTEIWRETVARRQRFEEVHAKLAAGEVREINDLITYNLDIELFAQDVIQNAEGPELVRAFWKALTSIKVLDPTVGSGAFLFAAMNILEPLYEDCIEQMEHFVSTLTPQDSPEKFRDFRAVLNQIREHANAKYFIYKTITIHNLYGVDIMEEAVETCKLRLFLKLVSQVEQKGKLEPLPDIDFNVRAGNTLVGFTSLEEVGKALTKATENQDGSGQNALLMTPDEENQLQRIEEEAKLASQAYARFQEMQTLKGGDARDYRGAKQELKQRLKGLHEELNRALALSYGINPEQKRAFQEWLESHQPFHWVIDFYDIIKQGGFDIIVGNPPYIEYRQVKSNYEVKGYQTEEAGNLYAYVIENCDKYLKKSGRFSMIVQLPIVCTDRMIPLQNFILEKFHVLWFSDYDDRPGKLFDGLEHIRATIFIFQKEDNGQERKIYSTKYNRWYSEEREDLFSNLQFEAINEFLLKGAITKVGSLYARNILTKLWPMKNELVLEKYNSKSCSYFHNSPQYWIRATTFPPYFWNERDGEKLSTQVKSLGFDNFISAYVYTAMMNSSLFYWWFVIMSDCRHLNMREVFSFPFCMKSLPEIEQRKLIPIVERLMDDYQSNRYRKETYYKTTGKVIYDEYYPKKSKSIIDEIDAVLARHYGFTDEELDFIINYDIKYRMGDELFDEGEQQGDAEAEEAESFVEEQDEVPARARHKQTAVKMELPLGFSAYHVYRCLLCNKLIPGFEAETHTAEVHGGEYPGYEKLGG